MKNRITLTQSVREQKFKTSLGKGVIIQLDKASEVLIKVLHYLYEKDQTLLDGDIEALLKMKEA